MIFEIVVALVFGTVALYAGYRFFKRISND